MMGECGKFKQRDRRRGGFIGALAIAVLFGLTGPASAQQLTPIPLVQTQGLDIAAGTVTLPLHHGRMPGGEAVWFVVLDTDDAATAERLGINWSPKLANAGGGALRNAAPAVPMAGGCSTLARSISALRAGLFRVLAITRFRRKPPSPVRAVTTITRRCSATLSPATFSTPR